MSDPALPFVRIVVVDYRSGDLTRRCVEHIEALTYPADRRELVVVVNESDGALAGALGADHPSVRFVSNADNRGFGGGCNSGIALPGSWDAIALVNNDSVPQPSWLDALVEALDQPATGRVGAVAGKVLLAGTMPALVNSAGCELREGGFNADRGDGSPDDGDFDEPCEVFGWSGASALLTKDMLDDIGAFDESYFLYYEDVDLVWRGRRRGWAVVYTPDAVSEHDRGSSAGRGELFWYHDTRNRLMVLARHAPLGWLARALLVQFKLVVTRPHDGPKRSTRLRALGAVLIRSVGLLNDRRRLERLATVDRREVTRWLVP